jgi:pheromone shutdown protein TraB
MLIRICYRENCFDTTLVHLTERFNGKEVYLIGTMNQSTMLAQRTKKLIEEIKPDTVLVQAHPK